MDLETNGEEKRAIQKTTQENADEAFTNHQIIIKIKQSITKDLWNLAIMLKINRDRRYYKTLGYETFEEYLGTPEISLSRGYTYKLIKNYELWVQKYNVPIIKLENIDSEKLYLAGMTANEENFEEHLDQARDLSRNDLRILFGKGIENEWIKNVVCPKCNYVFEVNEHTKHCNIPDKAIEWLNGGLLGDGSISLQSPYSANYQQSSKYLEYCKYIKDTLKFFGIEQTGDINKRTHKDLKGEEYYSYRYSSNSYDGLLLLRNKWYLEDKKIVPKDLKLTPLTCRQWYIDDGCLSHNENSYYIILSTEGFSFEDVEFLVKKLNDLNFKVTINVAGLGNNIHISAYSIRDFLNYIGDCPVECFKYKWDYPVECPKCQYKFRLGGR